MSKQIKATARGLAALGRGPDTMLVHMAPGEVAGLQKLAVASGGTLTMNPHTGLPEAGWLSSLLPIVAGAAASFMTGGAASPLLIAALGGASGAAGAKIEGEDPLSGGAMGLLSAFGGSGLTGQLMNAGRAGQVAAGTNTVLQGAGQGAAQTAAQGVGSTGVGAGTVLAPPLNGVPTLAQSPALNAAAQAQKVALPAVSTMNNTGALQAGLGSLNKAGVPSSIWGGMSNMEKLGTGAAAMNTMSAMSQSGGGGGGKKNKPLYYMTSAHVAPDGTTTFGPGQWDKNYNYETLGTYDPEGNNKYAIKVAAGGGIGSLPEAGGRYVQGPGDGVSDSIPAVINNANGSQQPAALADGEFVVDAQTVAKLGNGSNKAGAQNLYAMMRRVHSLPSQPGKDLNADKYLPA